MQRAQRVRGLDDPDAVDVPLRVLLDNVDVDPRVAQGDGRRKPADTAADDQDLLDVAHALGLLEQIGRAEALSACSACWPATSGKHSIIESGIGRFFQNVVPPWWGCQSTDSQSGM